MPSAQQNQPGSGQQLPSSHSVPPGQSFLAAILESLIFAATNGQSASVAAQYMPSAQQNQPGSGQQLPSSHSVPPGQSFLAAILEGLIFAATNGQSASVAAQYMPSL